jgi:LysR family transcriptional regulator, transcription activator of glutamate synthase operon
VRVGALPSIAELIVHHLVPYRSIAPDVRFTLFSETQSVLVEWLLDGRLDLAVAEPEVTDDLVTSDLGVEAIVVMLRADHRLASRSTLRPEDLVSERFIGCIRGLGNSRPAERFFSSLGTYPDPVVEVQDHRIMRDLIRQNVGFGLMTARTAQEAQSPDLVAIPTEPALERHVALLRSARRILPTAVLDFYAYLLSRWGMSDPLPPVPDHPSPDRIVAELVPALRRA